MEISDRLSLRKRRSLKMILVKHGFELMDDQRAILVEKIKSIIVELIHYTDEIPKLKFSSYLSERLNYDYNYLSGLFQR